MQPSQISTMAKWFIIGGIILVVLGVLLYFAPCLFRWFGKLPGDIRIENEQSKVIIPITSLILISILLTLVVNLIQWLEKYF